MSPDACVSIYYIMSANFIWLIIPKSISPRVTPVIYITTTNTQLFDKVLSLSIFSIFAYINKCILFYIA